MPAASQSQGGKADEAFLVNSYSLTPSLAASSREEEEEEEEAAFGLASSEVEPNPALKGEPGDKE